MEMGANMHNTNWIEVSKSSLINNLNQVRSQLNENTKIMAVVKADAYGHGLLNAAQIFADENVDYLGVTTIEEGISIREAGIEAPILLFTPLVKDQIEAAITNNLDLTICDVDCAKNVSEIAVKLDSHANIHVKVNTGMGRLGVYPDECVELFAKIASMPNLKVAGLYTHFADAASRKKTQTYDQLKKFNNSINKLKNAGFNCGMIHAANSSAIINHKNSHFDMVRPGTVLYGQYPSRHSKEVMRLENTWVFKTRIISTRLVKVNESIGYGREYKTNKDTLTAVIPVGYSDGFTLTPDSVSRRSNSIMRRISALFRNELKNTPVVSIKKVNVPVIGRISMQMCVLDISRLSGISVGEEVIVPMRRTSSSSRVARIIV